MLSNNLSLTSALILLLFILLLSGCVAGKSIDAQHKYSPEELQEDYSIFKSMLEDEHPGLYWYSTKEEMDNHFSAGEQKLKDSMTGGEFRKILSYITSKVKCGHTTVRPPRRLNRNSDSLRNKIFPLNIKFWEDTALITSSYNRKDSNIRRGAILTSIDGKPIEEIRDSLFQFLSTDGNNLTHKYQSLSNRGMFSNLYLSVYGYRDTFSIGYTDSTGAHKEAMINIFTTRRDTSVPIGTIREPRSEPTKKERRKMSLNNARSLSIDTINKVAIMEVNTFTRKFRLPEFYAKSFRRLQKEDIPNLVVDLRGNGGGSVTNSNLLTKYIATQPFKIADSIYAIRRDSHYGRLQEHRFLHWLFLVFMTRKEGDGNYHFNLFEEKFFKPKRRNHFDGNVFLLTGGNSFSAATLVAKALRDQENVIIVGEETGGGGYGNNAWLIPDVTLPNTKLRFRLPLFRLVIDKEDVKGSGVQPEVEAPPTVKDIMLNQDFKLNKVYELIKSKQ